jgi:hypothetical protein
MTRTRRTNLLGSDGADVRVNPRDITFPQSACPLCAHLGSGQPPWRWCRCETDYVTVASVKEYQRLVKTARPTREPRLARDQASMAGWALSR